MSKLIRINALSLAKLQAILMALIGFVLGIIYSIGGAIYDLIMTGVNFGTALAFFSLIGMPMLFAIIGYIFGLLGALLFNIIITKFGGIELNLSSSKK